MTRPTILRTQALTTLAILAASPLAFAQVQTDTRPTGPVDPAAPGAAVGTMPGASVDSAHVAAAPIAVPARGSTIITEAPPAIEPNTTVPPGGRAVPNDPSATNYAEGGPVKGPTTSSSKQLWTFLNEHTTLSIYGLVHVSVDAVSNGYDPHYFQVSSNLSRLGFKGKEDFGSFGMVWQYESEVRVDQVPTGSKNGLGSRDSFLGLEGDFGTFLIGKHESPYWVSTIKLDPFSATVGDYRNIMGNSGGENKVEFNQRVTNCIEWLSPKLYGLSAQAQVGFYNYDFIMNPGGQPTSTYSSATGDIGNDGDIKGNIYSANLAYENGPFYAVGAYQFHRKVDRGLDYSPTGNSLVTANEWAAKGGVGLDFKTTKLAGFYEHMGRGGRAQFTDGVATGTPGGERTRDGYWLTATQSIGWDTDVSGSFSQAFHSHHLDDDGAFSFAVGLFHNFSSWSKVYFIVAETVNQTHGEYGLGQGGHGNPILAKRQSDPTNPLTGFDTVRGPLVRAASLGGIAKF